MLSYDEVKAKVFVNVSHPDGYNGNRAIVGLALIDNKIIEVASCGYYTCPAVSCAVDQEEVMWLIENHPNFRDYKIV